jgi:hypothetical protein
VYCRAKTNLNNLWPLEWESGEKKIPHFCFKSYIWPSGQDLAFVPCGHGFNSHPDGQGVWRSVLLEPSGVGWWPKLSYLWKLMFEKSGNFLIMLLAWIWLFNLIIMLRSPPLLGIGSVMHLVCNTAWWCCVHLKLSLSFFFCFKAYAVGAVL